MENRYPFNSLLVPTDFSDAPREAFNWALRTIGGSEAVIIVLHVIDEVLIKAIADHEDRPMDEVFHKLRHQAENQLAEYKNAASTDVEVDLMVSRGLPFLEIVRKADDFAVDAIVMGRVGVRGPVEKMLFGSTAEKVIRSSDRPVMVLPQKNLG